MRCCCGQEHGDRFGSITFSIREPPRASSRLLPSSTLSAPTTMDIAGFVAAAEQYPPPTTADGARVVFSYGTAGFRTKGDVLASTVFRCGALAAARSHVTGRATGIVITASHNPEPDNGVKLVDCTGGMLPVAWEAHAEALANADGPDAVASVLERVVAAADPAENLHPPPPPGVAPHPVPPHVFLARDTRPTGPSLAAAAKAGAEAIGAVVTDCGLCTTPQLHWIVRASYRGDPHAEADYFARLAGGFAALVGDRTDDRARPSSDIHVDCANGVGASKLAALAAAAGDALPLRLRNVEGAPGSLNNRVGADHVQKEKSIPAEGGFETLPPGAKCVSVDGDADRLVYFTPGASGSALLFDGDKIAALVATHLADLLARCGDALAPPLRVGVVQTAYANGASTAYVAETLGLETACTPTGVKHLHPEAERFDVGVYFEANGHGTAVFSDDALCRVREAAAKTNARAKEGETNAADAAAALDELVALTEAINPAVGDALSGILVVEAVLRAKGWDLERWNAMYTDLPSKQVKVTVADRSVISTTDAERRATTPAGLQPAVDAAVAAAGPRARAFARPSGTEDVVRVYAEAETVEMTEALARNVARAVYEHAGGTGEKP